jgi:long-chain acyl-CoA synthetase
MALGGLKDWPVRKDLPLEVVPVDLVAAAILAVSALLLHGRHESVYHLATADRNPLQLERLVRLLDSEAERMTLDGIFQGKNGGAKLRNRPPLWIDPFRHVRFLTAEQARERRVRIQGRIDRAERWIGNLQDTLGAFRGASRALGEWSRSLRTLGLQARFREQTLDQYLPFIQENRYVFEAHNIRQGYALLRPEDRQRLPWDPERIDWEEYWRKNQIGGIKRWVEPEAVREWSFKI